ncbi:MAG: cytochrome c3 family protein [Tepidisphaerales bacterium]
MARRRDQKTLAGRIDPTYYRRPHPMRTVRGLLSFFALAATVFAVTFLSWPGDARLHNPGALTASHAFIQHDCRACHDGGGAGTAGPVAGFSKTVSDVACLACHDGAIHHGNQLTTTVNRFPPLDPTLQAGARAAGDGASDKLTAHNCVSCHVEHRGQAALAASHPQLCTSCHADLTRHTQDPAAVRVATRVTAFTLEDHPGFGRSLRADGGASASAGSGSARGPDGGAWVDPTVLKFNHAAHNRIEVLKDNCTACHAADDPQVRVNPPVATLPPPYGDPKDRPLAWSRSQDRSEMQPISFARHCVGCHAIELPGKVRLAVPHEDMSVVRAFLSGVPELYRQHLMQLPDKSSALEVEVVTGRPPRQRREKRVLTEGEWVGQQLAGLSEAIERAFGRDERYAAVKRAVAAAGSGGAATRPGDGTTRPAEAAAPATGGFDAPDVSVLEHFVTYGIAANCAYCHAVKGEVPAVAFGSEGTRVLTATVPTGIPDGPRRWFINSRFDHYAHRSMSCTECHSRAATSQLTSDVLSPDIGDNAAAGASCVSCHRPDRWTALHGEVRGAPSDCVTCHWFHDPLAERAPVGTVNPLTSLPTTRMSSDPATRGPYPTPGGP